MTHTAGADTDLGLASLPGEEAITASVVTIRVLPIPPPAMWLGVSPSPLLIFA